MPKENYRRIVKGYEPKEPAAFFEKVFYLFWLLICAFKVIAIRIKSRISWGGRNTLDRGWGSGNRAEQPDDS